MTTARYNSFTNLGIDCRVIIADFLACNVSNLGAQNIFDANKFGINGTFYSGSSVLQIAATSGGTAIAPGGTHNTYKRKTLVCYNVPGSSIPTVGLFHISDLSELSGLTINWAIGGVGYYLDQTFASEKDFLTYVNTQETTSGVSGFNSLGFNCYHTAIGYRSADQKVIMLTTSSNSSAWAVRSILKDYIGCNDAIYLDSNPSTEFRAKTSGGSIIQFPLNSSGIPDNKNATVSYVTVNPTSWL